MSYIKCYEHSGYDAIKINIIIIIIMKTFTAAVKCHQ